MNKSWENVAKYTLIFMNADGDRNLGIKYIRRGVLNMATCKYAASPGCEG